MRVLRHPDVLGEMLSLAERIARNDPAVGDQFLDACVSTFQSLARNPHMGRHGAFRHPNLQGARVWRVQGFDKHLIFYRPLNDGVEVLHVVHSSRNLEKLFP